MNQATRGAFDTEQSVHLPTPPSSVTTSLRAINARLGHYTLRLAQDDAEIREAQRLRYKVFVDEFGAEICSDLPGHDIDYFDNFCDHLIVRDEDSGRVVGTYRILPPHAARALDGYYSEKEFRLDRLDALRSQMVEVGRSCIHRDYRSGAVIGLLWSGLASYMAQGNYGYLIGCASVPMPDGGHNAANIYRALDSAHRAPDDYATFPLNRLPVERLGSELKPEIPPLIKGYLRAGAWICGEPAWDPQFNCADLLVLLPMSRLQSRYAKHYGRT
jgi:putative hemolysin